MRSQKIVLRRRSEISPLYTTPSSSFQFFVWALLLRIHFHVRKYNRWKYKKREDIVLYSKRPWARISHDSAFISLNKNKKHYNKIHFLKIKQNRDYGRWIIFRYFTHSRRLWRKQKVTEIGHICLENYTTTKLNEESRRKWKLLLK